MAEEPINTILWIEENEKDFLPPVCNKLMHNTQLKCFFVGGPNQRKDYHIEEGEEFFYMVKGDMCLKVMEQNKPKDVVIKEGECFLLPARIPHSPQREANTIGLVIERERTPNETDGLRYLVEKDEKPTGEVLYETWFHCLDLGPQLKAAIEEFFKTEQYKTGKPIPGTVLDYDSAPVKVDLTTKVMKPFCLESWLQENDGKLKEKGFEPLFGDNYTSTINVHGHGKCDVFKETAEVFFWVLKGEASVLAGEKMHKLRLNDSLLVPINTRISLDVQDFDSRVLAVYMVPLQRQ